MKNYEKFKRTLVRLQQIKKESGIGYFKSIRDYYFLKRKIQISFYEYYSFEFEKQTEVFRNSFLSYNNKYKYLEILNPRKNYILARNKYFTHLLLGNTGIEKTELFCYYNPTSIIENKSIGYDYKSILKILKDKNIEKCMIKTTESTHGKGIFLIISIDYKDNSCYLNNFDGQIFELSQLLKKEPLIFESVIEQTEQFKLFNLSSVNSIRFLTILLPTGKAEVISAVLKIGKNGSCVDNAGNGGNIDTVVNIETGEVHSAMQFDGWRKTKMINHNPENGVLLEGVFIDNWHAIKNKVIQYQQAIPFLRAIGWDIALTDKGPVVIEMNDFWDESGQLFLGKGWKQEIESCYNEWIKYGVVLK